jgi:hypothetical protein
VHASVVPFFRVLMFSFAGDFFMPPQDPLGRHGPLLDEFLRLYPNEPTKKLLPKLEDREKEKLLSSIEKLLREKSKKGNGGEHSNGKH